MPITVKKARSAISTGTPDAKLTAAPPAAPSAPPAAPPAHLADMKVLDLKAAAEIAGVSLRTLNRRISEGAGPPVTRMSVRRVGVRVGDLRRWLDTLQT